MTGDPCPHVWAHFPRLAFPHPGPRGASERIREHHRDLPRNGSDGRRVAAGHAKGAGVQCCECSRHVVTSGSRFCAEHEPREDGES
jgi:hypothetical protein